MVGCQGKYFCEATKVVVDVLVSEVLLFFSLFALLLCSKLDLPASHHAQVPELFPLSNSRFLELLGDHHEREGIFNKVAFDVYIKWCVCREGRSVVDFQKDGIDFIVDDDVKAKQLEAHVTTIVLRLRRTVLKT